MSPVHRRRCPGCRGTGMNALRKRKEREVGRMGGRPSVPTAVFPSLAIGHGLPVQCLHKIPLAQDDFFFISFF